MASGLLPGGVGARGAVLSDTLPRGSLRSTPVRVSPGGRPIYTG